MANTKDEKETAPKMDHDVVPVDPRDEKIKGLEADVVRLQKKLTAAKSAPVGDTVTIAGKSYAVKGTVMAKFALDEVKKGHIDEDCTLVIIDRKE